MTHRSGFAAVILFAAASGAIAADAIRKLPNTYAYEGPKIKAVAIHVRGPGAWAREFPIRLANDLKANGIEVVDASDLGATAANDDEIVLRVKEAGFVNVMFIEIASSAYVNGVLLPSSTLQLTVVVRSVDGKYSWSTAFDDHSSAMGRAGKLIRAGSEHVIDAMKKDGLISSK